MLIAHHDEVPVLVGADPTIKALIAVGDALISCTMIAMGVMFVRYSEKKIASQTPYT